MKIPGILFVSVGLCLLLGQGAFGIPRLPAIFGDHMVLQREQPMTVWGWASPGESVMVEFAGEHASTEALPDGTWRATLPSMSAGGPYALRVRDREGETVCEDVLIGDVWLASGQSNMEWILRETDDAAAEIAASGNDSLRMIRVARQVSDVPREDIEGSWLVSSPEKSGWFSAVGYYFAKTLIKDLNVPVGIINASRGASQIIPWIPCEVVETSPVFAEDLEKWDAAVDRFPEAKHAYEEKLAVWEKADPQRRGAKPYAPYGPGHYNTPGGLYNGMIAPLRPLAIRGIIWYQGEANARKAAQYRTAFPLLIESWREAWDDPTLPFLFVQIAPYAASGFAPEGIERAELRDAQASALALPKTGMVVTLDIGGPAEHPRNKKDVGERLAHVAERVVYGRDILADSPRLNHAQFEHSQVRVFFDYAPGGLTTSDGGESPVLGFELAGADGVFHPAEASVEGTTVLVHSTSVTDPVRVRYAWSNLPEVNLVNQAGLPAVPFYVQK